MIGKHIRGTDFFGSGAVNSVIRLPGSHTSITFTHTSETWHGFTLGVNGLPEPPGAPAPTIMLLFGFGIMGLATARRFKQ